MTAERNTLPRVQHLVVCSRCGFVLVYSMEDDVYFHLHKPGDSSFKLNFPAYEECVNWGKRYHVSSAARVAECEDMK